MTGTVVTDFFLMSDVPKRIEHTVLGKPDEVLSCEGVFCAIYYYFFFFFVIIFVCFLPVDLNIDGDLDDFVNSPLVLTTEVCNPGKCQAGKMEGVCISGESCFKHGGRTGMPCNGSTNLICCTCKCK